MSGRWTGGQYSFYRAVLGTYLFAQFLCLTRFVGPGADIPDGSAESPIGSFFPNILSVLEFGPVLGIVTVVSVFLAVGMSDRIAAVVLWYVWFCLLGKGFLVSDSGTHFVGFLLLAHIFVPTAPYGSWDARGRVDPGGGWRLPKWIHTLAWIVMSLGYAYTGYSRLVDRSWIDGSALGTVGWGVLVFELLFAPLALFGRVRPWIWTAMVVMQLSLIPVVDSAGFSLGLVLLLLFTFDPGWVKPLRAGSVDRLFYDGTCGMCHRTVRFLLAEDASGTAFRFAPLDSDSFRETVPPERREGLPDSVVLLTATGTLLMRSRAVLTCMERLGGYWRVIAIVLGLVPVAIADWVYDRIASIRYKLFRRPSEACPVLPPELRERFDA